MTTTNTAAQNLISDSLDMGEPVVCEWDHQIALDLALVATSGGKTWTEYGLTYTFLGVDADVGEWAVHMVRA